MDKVEEPMTFKATPLPPLRVKEVPVALLNVTLAKELDVLTVSVEKEGVEVTLTVTVPVFPETVMFVPARVEVTPLLYIVMVPVEFDNTRLLVEAA